MQVAFEIVVTPLRCGKFAARLGDRIILKSSRQPLLDAARVLLAEGADPEARIGMRHAGANHVALQPATSRRRSRATSCRAGFRRTGNRTGRMPWYAPGRCYVPMWPCAWTPHLHLSIPSAAGGNEPPPARGSGPAGKPHEATEIHNTSRQLGSRIRRAQPGALGAHAGYASI